MEKLKVSTRTGAPCISVPSELAEELSWYLRKHGVAHHHERGTFVVHDKNVEDTLELESKKDAELAQFLLDRWEGPEEMSPRDVDLEEEPLSSGEVSGSVNLTSGPVSVEAAGTFTPPPSFVIAWDPELLDESDYADLVAALGDIVRASGGEGVQRIKSRGFGVPCGAEVYQ